MNKYLLLRDNKESGPYTVSEIIAKGIKPYDLVWLEGKSAAWRYPSEIDELKIHAPVVEEQPFDRFYKKPAEQEIQNGALAAAAASYPQPMAEHVPYLPKQAESSKKVYINFPGSQQKIAVTQPVKASVTQPVKTSVSQPIQVSSVNDEKSINARFPDHSQHSVKEKIKDRPNNGTTSERIIPLWKESIPINKYDSLDEESRPFHEFPASPAGGINDQHGEKRSFNKMLFPATVAACLVLAGLLIGLAFNYQSQSKDIVALNAMVQQIQQREKQRVNQVTPTPAPAHDQVTDSVPEIIASAVESLAGEPHDMRADQSGASMASAASRKKDQKTQSIVEKSPVVNNTPQPESRAAPAVQPQDNIEKPAVSKDAISHENLYKLVSVQGNKYKTGVLGGISDLKLELTNNSLYLLQKVEVKINYLGPEKKIVRSQSVYFDNVAPGAQLSLDVPKSNRGVSVNYSVVNIHSGT